jgi:hypothetical protein
MRQQEAN